MPRFFINEKINGDNYSIFGEDAIHISKSLRMKSGEALTLCDSQSIDYVCEIDQIDNKKVDVKVISFQPNDTESKVKINLYQCIPKGDKFESVVQKSVELGVYSIVPVLSSRCISRPDTKSMKKKIDRLQKIAKHAAEQSNRGIIPQIKEMVTLEKALEKCDNSILFYENANIKISESKIDSQKEINIFIGSEGGFSTKEVEFAENNGAQILSLGKRILRTETASLAALSAFMYRFGEI